MLVLVNFFKSNNASLHKLSWFSKVMQMLLLPWLMLHQGRIKVSLCHMSCQVGNVGGVEETFLYRLRPGACPESYGVNVARLAGLPDSILQNAGAKSRGFEAVCGQHKRGSQGNLAIQSCDKMVVLIQSLINATTSLSCHESAGMDISSVTELQDKARIFLQQN